MAHGRLNEDEQASAFYDQAVPWRMGIGYTEEELRRLCAESATVLSQEVPPTLKESPVLTPGPALLKPATGAALDNGALDRGKSYAWEFNWSDVPRATQYQAGSDRTGGTRSNGDLGRRRRRCRPVALHPSLPLGLRPRLLTLPAFTHLAWFLASSR